MMSDPNDKFNPRFLRSTKVQRRVRFVRYNPRRLSLSAIVLAVLLSFILYEFISFLLQHYHH